MNSAQFSMFNDRYNQQFRMTAMQVFNWGTFTGLHRINIAVDGCLLVGKSGSGKSTLLDAMSTLLVPPQWLGFNAAAREGDRNRHDRNLALYIRGAWGDQTDSNSGAITTQFLRNGSTWSAIALEFKNKNGRIINLIGIFILRGNSVSTVEVKRHYMIAEREFDFAKEFTHFDLDIRKFKLAKSELFHADKFKSFSERFRLLLNIETEMALKLLHKTQSAKNLGDLNLFLREYMLDEPETFAVANRLVDEFAELDAAHQSVLTAREQVNTLLPIYEHDQRMQRIAKERNQLAELLAGVESYKTERTHFLTKMTLTEKQAVEDVMSIQHQTKEYEVKQLKNELLRLENQHLTQGGERIQQLKIDKEQAERQKQQRIEKRNQVEYSSQQLGKSLPGSPQDFASLLYFTRNFLDNWRKNKDKLEQLRDILRDKLNSTEQEFFSVRQEIDSMLKHPSNIPAHMLNLRSKLSQAIGIHETELPFVGELIEVKTTETDWRGAIERILHGFGLSLLVKEKYYHAVSAFVNDTQLQQRLVYYKIGETAAVETTIPDFRALIHKIELKKGECYIWLENELKQRFNYICVENLRDFKNTERAITREGLIRHGKTRHEKDDRYTIDDQRHWILGFNNHQKLQLYKQKAQELAIAIDQLSKELIHNKTEQETQDTQALACQAIINITWQEIDVASKLDEIARLTRELTNLLNDNLALKTIEMRIQEQKKELDKKITILKEEAGKLAVLQNEIKNLKTALKELSDIDIYLTPYQQIHLSEYFSKFGHLTLTNVADITIKVINGLNRNDRELAEANNKLQSAIERIFQIFKNKWPQDSADQDSTIASLSEFIAKLNRLQLDGLPVHEERFFNMLRQQSMENLAALNTYLSQARNDILQRMELVNESLKIPEFNPGTQLQIHVTDRHLESVKLFRQEIRNILNNAWIDTREQAEERFAILRKIVDHLRSQDTAQQRWRQEVLDVRLHVEFVGRESRKDNDDEVEIHRSGAGKSGGQREKLAAVCLAAALSYQLGGRNDGFPLYAPVVLDEAFSKADTEFTQEAMRVFITFGFQMIIATPIKSVTTLEPFIGGAALISIKDRKQSSILQIEYDHEHRKLKLGQTVETTA